MARVLALTFDVRKRLLIGATNKEESGFSMVNVGDDEIIVVTCEGSFSWRVMDAALLTEEAPAVETSPPSEPEA